ncbi:S8 family serine peptidase [Nitriliruptor alkaliphilus]|uniref:S8 family serine peptidase n=1 Tax=Nitriliruptor alkaliphilus TaxID=427918 RepID=UPI000698E753|nr:S8 family serine peptidase [Nitriliruptor alkaliphilus]
MRRVPTFLIAAALATASLGASGDGDPLRDRQYGLDVIGAPEAWQVSRGAGQVIAIVDTGIHLDHPDLASKLLRDRTGTVVGFDAVDGRSPEDGNGHGTLVAGTAAAATGNGIGIASVAPEALLMPIRVLDDRGEGSMADVDRGIRWAVDNGADVINLSLELAIPRPGGIISGAPDAAVRYAWERGVVVVAAAGNSGTPFTDYAPSTPVLLVGATDARDRQTSFSDSGRRDMVLAPGVDIVSTACDPCGPAGTATYASASGTSFSAPHVAGAVAVLLAQGRSPAEAVAALRETAVPVPRPATSLQQGHGRIDLAAAVARPRASNPSAPAPSAPSPRTTETPRPAPAPAEPGPEAVRPSPSSEPAPEPQAPVEGPATDAVPEAGDEADTGGPALEEDPTPVAPEATTDHPPTDEVALPSPRGGPGGPLALALLAGSMVIATGAASLRALGAAAAADR